MSKHHRATEAQLRGFGALIVRKRIEKGFSSEELARKLGISQSSLSRIENGNREPRFEIVRRLNKFLDITDNVVNFLERGTFNG